ncbi:2,3-bisphosphoglycerate-independent phosphoglycerate mutase [Radicibacter daui]|uniref:2,3-bisphosphoglycerate-independent phosphoglycerate mutase n=1 Tax=Radicibacter daui TaxID=3064829 RepID=UPI004046B177
MSEVKGTKRPVVLCVLDGWGWREEEDNNAVRLANTPTFDRIWASCPTGFLDASGHDVGLPDGQIGNSEVGHMNIGAGRVVFQDLPMIDNAINTGELKTNEALQGFIAALKASGGTAHLSGLTSPGGVHAHQRHIAALAREIASAGVPVIIHVITDGRDVPPKSAKEQLEDFIGKDLAGAPGKITLGTVVGRYYSLDRDNRWERVSLAYDLWVSGKADKKAADAPSAIQAAYDEGLTDEFITPVVLGDYAGMKDGDGFLMCNYRADRAREILSALGEAGFTGFERTKIINFAAKAGMVEYSDKLKSVFLPLFPPKDLRNVLGEVVAAAGKTQLRIAETEKYPHVTFFLNGGRETEFAGEERIVVASPKVATYDLQPEMSEPEVAARVVAAIDSGKFDMVVINFANPDMVGHSGVLEAAIKAVEAVDTGLGQMLAAIERQGGAALVTADHGNCEQMWDYEKNCPHTAHTLNKVPVILVGAPADVEKLRNGRLADLAPTVLELMGVAQPAEMTGVSLLKPAAGAAQAAE